MDVLVVDNDEDDLSDIASGAAKAGASSVRRFASEKDVVNYLKTVDESGECVPDFLLVDLKMERQDSGVRVVNFIRKTERFRHIPVIVISSTEDAGEVISCYIAGANSFVDKGDGNDFEDRITKVANYWINIVRLK